MNLRKSNITKLKDSVYDVLIIGGGINGAVSAAALSAKGAKVGLIDKGDFAGMTSQESSNLAWGGIKYMESMEFALVRKLCMSRNRLMRSYPSAVREIRFLLTIPKRFRFPPIFLYIGTWIYWVMGNGFTKTPRYVMKKRLQREAGVVKRDKVSASIEYSDACLHDNDARFVFNFIRSAMDMSCIAANYLESEGSVRGDDGLWVTKVKDGISGETFKIKSKVLINAAGPLVDYHNKLTGQVTGHCHVLSKGIHLIVPRISPVRRVLSFFADDGRLFFVIPMGRRTCIGTTDTRVDDPYTKVTESDRTFILSNINGFLNLEKPLTKNDIIAERCGVRPLVVKSEDVNGPEVEFLQLSRKHVVEVNSADAHISILGGKLTDCINVGKEVSKAVQRLGVTLPFSDYTWYGEPVGSVRNDFFHQAELMNLDDYTSEQSFEPLSTRLWRRYGAKAFGLLEHIREDPREAEVLIKGTEYLRCELRLAARQEMITKLDDFLRRRSKIALVETTETIKNSEGIMDACRMLFGDQAQMRFDEYIGENK